MRVCDVGVVSVAQCLPRMACLDISLCSKVSENGLKVISNCCRALLRLVMFLALFNFELYSSIVVLLTLTIVPGRVRLQLAEQTRHL